MQYIIIDNKYYSTFTPYIHSIYVYLYIIFIRGEFKIIQMYNFLIKIYIYLDEIDCLKKKKYIGIVVAPIDIVLHSIPCLNNVQFNPIIFKSKTFLVHSILCSMYFICGFIVYELKLIHMYTKYNEYHVILINLYFSIIIPLTIYCKNPSLRKYL